MAQKFIITDDTAISFRMGNVEMHVDLKPKDTSIKVISGGKFHIDRENNIFWVYGQSYDFGKATIEQIRKTKKESYLSPAIESLEWRFVDNYRLDLFDENIKYTVI